LASIGDAIFGVQAGALGLYLRIPEFRPHYSSVGLPTLLQAAHPLRCSFHFAPLMTTPGTRRRLVPADGRYSNTSPVDLATTNVALCSMSTLRPELVDAFRRDTMTLDVEVQPGGINRQSAGEVRPADFARQCPAPAILVPAWEAHIRQASR
jgi:hypothetical protein